MAENVNEHKVIFSADIADIKGKLQELQKAMQDAGVVTATAGNQMANSMGASMAKIGSSLSSLGTSLSVGLTAPLLLLGKSALQTSAQMEQISVSFEVFTGSAETAKEMLGQLKDQAIKSPMQFQDITKGAQTLLGYGLTASQVIPITRMLGDVSGGNADKFSRLSLAFGQVNAAGRLMGQEARQMINAGFNPLQAIADKTGVSMAVLTKKMHDGQISVKDVGDAFIYATSEGGRFFGMADRQSQTLQGSFNKLQESAKFALGEIGDSLNTKLAINETLQKFSAFLTELKNKFVNLSPDAQELTLKIAGIAIAIGPVLLLFGKLISMVTALSKAIGVLSLSGGGLIKIVLSIAAATLLGTIAEEKYDKIMRSAEQKDPELLKLRNKELRDQIKILDELSKKAPNKLIIGATLDASYIKTKADILKEKNNIIAEINRNSGLLAKMNEKSKAEAKLTGLSEKPSGLGAKTKAEKVEVIPGIDFQTKEYGNKLKALIKENKEAGMVINAWWKDNDIKRLDELTKDYKVKKELADKEGIDILNITKKYEDAKNAIIFDAENKKVDFREKARAKYMVVPPDTRKRSPGQQVQDSMTAALSKDKASNLENLGQALYAAQKDFANNLAGGFAEIAGSVLSGGMTIQDSFAALGAMLLTSVGDYLVKAGSAAVAAGLIKEVFKDALNPIGEGTASIAGGLIAITTGTAMKQLGSSISTSQQARTSGGTMATPSVASKASGSSYQYGGSSYATQSLRLMVDLTGSITATQTGYSINKSLETTLRVTGR